MSMMDTSPTEGRNPDTLEIDRLDTADMLRMMNRENSKVVPAVEAEIPHIAQAVEAVVRAMETGHRLIYIGAGTSGRLCVMDAAECPPTFGVSSGTVVAVLAGGAEAMTRAVESVEDDALAGAQAMDALGLVQGDVVVGVSASGGARYVLAALRRAREVGSCTVGICCNPDSPMKSLVDVQIAPNVGPEAIAGSTRLKAGTAQKLVLNMISTGAMVRTGKVYENLMVNIRPSNRKLRARAIGIIMALTGVEAGVAEQALDGAGGDIRRAVDNLKSRNR